MDLLLLLRQCIADLFCCFYLRVCLGKWATNDCLDEGLSQVLQSNARSAPTMIRYQYGYRLRSGRLRFGDGQLRLEPEVKHAHAHTKSSGSWEGLGASGRPESVPVSVSVLEVWGSVSVWVSGIGAEIGAGSWSTGVLLRAASVKAASMKAQHLN